MKICPDCGAHLDPGEKCDCNGKPLPVIRKAKPKKKKNTVEKAWSDWFSN